MYLKIFSLCLSSFLLTRNSIFLLFFDFLSFCHLSKFLILMIKLSSISLLILLIIHIVMEINVDTAFNIIMNIFILIF